MLLEIEEEGVQSVSLGKIFFFLRGGGTSRLGVSTGSSLCLLIFIA